LLGGQFRYLGASPETSTFISDVMGTTSGLVFAVSLLALFYRRTAAAEVKRLSDPADYFALALLLAVAVTGLHMRLASPVTDLAEVRSYLAGLLTFRPVPLPREPIVVSHFTLVNVLLLYFPFSKLVHLTGAFASQALVLQSPPAYPTPAGAAQKSRLPAALGGDAP
jgi:nitrate reductase gamma subunit